VLENGLVITCFGQQVLVEDDAGAIISCTVRPNITEPVVAGDRVVWLKEGKQQGVIVSCHPRSSILGRPNKQGKVKPMAANITQLAIVVAAKPAISWPLLDSYLVLAESLQLQITIVLNKCDLTNPDIFSCLQQIYQPLQYRIILCSSMQEMGLDTLKEALVNHITIFVGQSGVGKSSIIHALLPWETNVKIKEISDLSELGKHTTSHTTFYHLPDGGAIIDSPGVREFKLSNISPAEVTWGFREFRPYLQQCQYRNCNHITDRGCSLLKAMEQGQIAKQRYQNYVTLVQQYTNP
jgi:ribosome biogenesis GTPase